jgi:hypothetical protein
MAARPLHGFMTEKDDGEQRRTIQGRRQRSQRGWPTAATTAVEPLRGREACESVAKGSRVEGSKRGKQLALSRAELRRCCDLNL